MSERQESGKSVVLDMQLQRPTLPGKVDGVVGWDPLELQCRDCGAVYVGTHRGGFDILLAGFLFHICEGRDGIRRCPDCLKVVIAACPNARCKR